MKKSEATQRLFDLLKTWEDCKIESRLAEEVLEILEENGLIKEYTPEDHERSGAV